MAEGPLKGLKQAAQMEREEITKVPHTVWGIQYSLN
jgi:hypothetical protein